jgi:hypothetical protein
VDVKQAVKAAKDYLSDLFQDEGLINLGLEEIEYDERDEAWNITLGFSRPWNTPQNPVLSVAGADRLGRSYRVVKVRGVDGRILSVKLRELQD